MLSDYMGPVHDDLREIKAQVKETNGRVGILEKWRIERDAREDERAKAAEIAAALVASKAAAALEVHERSRVWKIGIAGLAVTAMSVCVPIGGAIMRGIGIL